MTNLSFLVLATLVVLLLVALALQLSPSLRPPTGSSTGHTVNLDALLGLRHASQAIPAEQGPYLVLFVSRYDLCPEALTEIHEYLQILGGTNPTPSVAHLLLEHDATKALHFSESRDLGSPVLYGASEALLDSLYDGDRGPSKTDVAPAATDRPSKHRNRLPTIFFIETSTGAVLNRQLLTNYVSHPLNKLAILRQALPVISPMGAPS